MGFVCGKGAAMPATQTSARTEKDYDLFERTEGESLFWHGCVHGLENARRKLQQLAGTTTNECSVIYVPTRQVVALANIAHTKRIVFQIDYDEQLLAERTDLLRRNGYEVVSAMDNECAKAVLNLSQRVDLFIVGHNAPEETRREIVVWLKTKHPQVPVVALNPPECRELPGADYNAVFNGPETWLPIVEAAAA